MIELLVVIAIIGVLAAVAIPAYNKYKEDAKIGVLNTTTNVVSNALNTCLALKSGATCSAATELQIKYNATDIAVGAGGSNGTAQANGTDTNVICYDIQSAGTFAGKGHGCADSAGNRRFCEWGTATTAANATSGAICANGACTAKSSDPTHCK